MLKPVAAGHSIVVNGAWNNRIFTPPWIEKTFSTPEIEIALSPSNVTFPLRLKFDGIYLQPGADRIVITPVELSDGSLVRMQGIAIRLLETLSHTPISGTGVNLRYIAGEPTTKMVRVFSTSDKNAISDANGVISNESVRRLIKGLDAEFFLSLEQKTGGQVAFELNFHKDTQTTTEAIDHLMFGLTNFQTLGREFLNRVYVLEE